MALGAVTELEIFTAVKARMTAAGGWFATPDLKFHFGRRPPNANPTDPEAAYVVVAVEEQDADDNVESDGAVAQRFAVEMAVRAVGAEDAELANAALITLDPRWDASNPGLTLTDTDKGVVGVMPKSGKLRLLERLQAGSDQYTATRRWEVWTGALIGV